MEPEVGLGVLVRWSHPPGEPGRGLCTHFVDGKAQAPRGIASQPRALDGRLQTTRAGQGSGYFIMHSPPGLALVLPHLPWEAGMIMPIFQMRRVRLREGK